MSFEASLFIIVALAFDFVNGFHDAANSIATVVSTRVLHPRLAVAWAAFWNFIAFAVFGTAVADRIGKGTIDISQIASLDVILAGLIGAIAWDLITWYFGLPTSSSHALVGGLAGAAIVYKGAGLLVTSGFTTIMLFIVLSPLIGFLLATVLMNVVLAVTQNVVNRRWAHLAQANWLFRKLQLVSAAAYSLGHGANDAQKTMGVIAAIILIDKGLPVEEFEVELWMVLSAHAAIAAGNDVRGLAHSAYPWFQDHEAAPRRWVLCRNRSCHHALRYGQSGNPRLDDPHDYRISYRSWSHQPCIGNPVGAHR